VQKKEATLLLAKNSTSLESNKSFMNRKGRTALTVDSLSIILCEVDGKTRILWNGTLLFEK
jgi:hypothetical protein